MSFRPAALLLSAILLAAGEAPAPLVSATLPDLARTRNRIAAGPFQGLWELPAMQRLRGLIPAAEVDPQWWALAERAAEARFRLLPGATPADDPQAQYAVRAQGCPFPALAETPTAVAGDWWLVGEPPPVAAPPATPGDPQADLRVLIDVAAMAATMEPAEAAKFRAGLALFGLSRIEAQITATPQGFHDLMRLPGCILPVRAIDPAACAGLPAELTSFSAVGVDGAALVRLVRGLLELEKDGWSKADRDCRRALGLGLDQVLGAIDGTVVVATTSGVPVPGVTIALPATPASDALVAAILDRALPGQAAQLVQEAGRAAVPLPAGDLPLMPMLRRGGGRWILSSDVLLIEALAAPAAAPAVAPPWQPPAGALAHLRVDNRTYMQLVASAIGMAGMRQNREQAAVMGALQQALVAVGTRLPPSTLTLVREGAGLRAEGDNNLIGPGPVAAGMLLPAIMLVRESARKAQAGSNMRQIGLVMIAYTTDNDGAWPKDIAKAVEYAAGELTPKLLTYPGRPAIMAPFLYVRPHPAAKAIQPVLISDPACQKGKGSLVFYADGHIGQVKGTALWEEGKRLAASPKAGGGGIETVDWTAVVNPDNGVRVVK